jgi:laccase
LWFVVTPNVGGGDLSNVGHVGNGNLPGEWWNEDVEEVIARALARGGSYNLPNALTINGQPGFLYNSSVADAYRLQLQSGHTYLLRLVNACMNFALFFAVAKHRLTVVKFDSAYVVPFTVNVILIQPGQTLDALLTASHQRGRFYMAASVFSMPNSSIVFAPLLLSICLALCCCILFCSNG